MYHKTKEGKVVLISEMGDSHLLNTIRWVERKSKLGLTIIQGDVSGDSDERWADIETVYGKEALEYLNYGSYIKEARKRRLL